MPGIFPGSHLQTYQRGEDPGRTAKNGYWCRTR